MCLFFLQRRGGNGGGGMKEGLSWGCGVADPPLQLLLGHQLPYAAIVVGRCL